MSYFNQYPTEALYYHLSSLQNEVTDYRRAGLDNEAARTAAEFYDVSRIIGQRTGSAPLFGQQYPGAIQYPPGQEPLRLWMSNAPQEKNLPVYGVDAEYFSTPEGPVPFSLAVRQAKWNAKGDQLLPLSGKNANLHAVVRPNHPDGTPYTDQEIEKMLNTEIPNKGVTYSQYTGLSIQNWKDPTSRGGQARVYTGEQVGAWLRQKFELSKSPPVILGHNLESRGNPGDIGIINNFMQQAGGTTLHALGARKLDTYLMAQWAGVQGSKSLSGVYETLGNKKPLVWHNEWNDVTANIGVAGPLMSIFNNPSLQASQGSSPPPPPLSQGNLPPMFTNNPPGGTLGGGNLPPAPPAGGTGAQFNPLAPVPMDQFRSLLEAQLRSTLGRNYQISFKSKPSGELDLIDGRMRMSVAPIVNKKVGEAMMLDVAPGHTRMFGPSIRMHVPESEYYGSQGPAAGILDLNDPSRQWVHSPLQAFAQNVAATFSQAALNALPGESPTERFRAITSLGPKIPGMEQQKVTGGLQWVGPASSDTAASHFSNRPALYVGQNIRDMDAAYNVFYNRAEVAFTQIRQAGAEAGKLPMETHYWSAMRWFSPVEQNQHLVRLAQTGNPISDTTLSVAGKDAQDALKRLRLQPGIRDIATPITLGAGNRPMAATPTPISETSMDFEGRAGYKMLGGSMPGQTERFVGYVQPRVAEMATSLYSGSFMPYRDVLKEQGIVAEGFGTQLKADMPQLTMTQLKNAKWQWGRFHEKTTDGVTSYEQVESELPKALGTDETAILGLVSYKSKGGADVTQPLRFSSPGRPTFLTGQPTLYIPPSMSRGSTKGAPGMPTGAKDEPQDVMGNIYLDDIQKAFGGNVLTRGMKRIGLTLPAHTEGSAAIKGPFKSTFMPPVTRKGEDLSQYSSLLFNTGEMIKGQVTGVGGEVKLPEYAFAGHFLSMTPGKREEMLGLFSQVKPELGAALQEYARTQHGKRETVMHQGQLIQDVGGLYAEDMAQIYAKQLGQNYAWGATSEKMYAHMRQLTEALPQKEQWQRFEYLGNVQGQFPMGLASASDRLAIQRSMFQGVYEALGSKGVDLSTSAGRQQFRQAYGTTWGEMREKMISFTPTNVPLPEGEYRNQNYGRAINAFREKYYGGLSEEKQLGAIATLGQAQSTAFNKALSDPKNVFRLGNTMLTTNEAGQGVADQFSMDRWKVAQAMAAQRGYALGDPTLRGRTMSARMFPIKSDAPTNSPLNQQYYDMKVAGPAAVYTMAGTLAFEHRGDSPKWGYEEMRALSFADPKLAKWLGLNINNPEGWKATGELPRHLQGWQQIGEVARWMSERDEARIGGMKVTEMSPDLSAKILSMSDEEILASKGLGGEGHFYSRATNYMLPRPEAMESVSTVGFKDNDEVKVALSQYGRRYPAALKALARGDTPETAGGGDLQSVYGMMTDIFRSSERSIAKLMSSRFLAQGQYGRFGGVLGPGFRSGVMPAQSLNDTLTALARQADFNPQHMTRDPITGEEMPWIKLARSQLAAKGYVPDLVNRFPTVSPGNAMEIMPVYTEAQLAARGLNYPKSTLVSGGQITPGSPMTTGMVRMLGMGSVSRAIGDFDADPAAAAALMKADKEKGLLFYEGSGEANDSFRKIMGMSARDQVLYAEKAIAAAMGGTRGGSYNVLNQSVSELQGAYLSGKHGREAGLPGTQPKTISEVGWREMTDEARLRLAAGPSSSGRPYTAAQLIEASASALGWSPKYINEMRQGQLAFYQPYLDTKTQEYKARGGPHNVETLLSTSHLGVNLMGEYKLVAKGTNKGDWTTLWQASDAKFNDQRNWLFGQASARLVTESIAEDIAGMKTPNYRLASIWTATKEEDVEGLATKMQELAKGGATPQEAIRTALWGRPGTEVAPAEGGYYRGKDPMESPFVNAWMTAWTGNTMGWQRRTARTATLPGGEEIKVAREVGTQMFPWQGGTASLAGMWTSDRMSMTANLYSMLRHESGIVGADPDRKQYAPTPISALERAREMEQNLLKQGKVPAPALTFMANQYRAEQYGVSANMEPDVFGKRLTTAMATSWLAGRKPTIDIGSTTLPLFSLPAGMKGMPGAAEMQQRKLEWFAQQNFGMKAAALQSPSERVQAELNPYIQAGIKTEEMVSGQIAQEHNMFQYETVRGKTKPLIGPIMGVPHERQGVYANVADYLPKDVLEREGNRGLLPSSSLAPVRTHFAPDVMGPKFDDKGNPIGILQASVKWAKSAEGAAAKATTPSVEMQEAQYSLASTAAGARGRRGWMELVAPMLRESTWFKEHWGEDVLAQEGLTPAQIRAEQNRVVQANVKAWMGGYTAANEPDVRMYAYTGNVKLTEEAMRANNWTEEEIASHKATAFRQITPAGGTPMTGLPQRYAPTIAYAAAQAQQMSGTPEGVREGMIQMHGAAYQKNTLSMLPPAFRGIGETAPEAREYLLPSKTIITPGSPLAKRLGEARQQMAPLIAGMDVNESVIRQRAAAQQGGWNTDPSGNIFRSDPSMRRSRRSFYGERWQGAPGGGGGGGVGRGGGGTGDPGGGGGGPTDPGEYDAAWGAGGFDPNSAAGKQLMLNVVFSGPGQLQQKSISQLQRGLASTMALSGNEAAMNFETTSRAAMAGMLGLEPTAVANMGYGTLLASSWQAAPDQMRRYFYANRTTIDQLTYGRNTSWQAAAAIRRNNFPSTAEERSAVGQMMGMGLPDAARYLGGVVGQTGPNPMLASLGRSMYAGGAFREFAHDTRMDTGKALQVSTEALEKFGKALFAARESTEQYQKTVDSTTATYKEKQVAEGHIQAAVLRQAQIPHLKAQYAAAQLWAEEFKAGVGDPAKAQEIFTALKTLPKQINQAEIDATKAEEQAAGKGAGGAAGMSKFFRRALGGFGLMYLQSITGLATSGWGYGQTEATNLNQLLQKESVAVGAPGPIANQMQRIANLTALAGSGMNPLASIQELRAQSPAVNQLMNFGTSMLGAYGGLMWYGSMSAPNTALNNLVNGGVPINAFGRSFGTLTAGKLALGVAAANIVGSGIASFSDTESSAYKYARALTAGGGALLSGALDFGTMLTSWDVKLNPEEERGRATRNMLWIESQFDKNQSISQLFENFEADQGGITRAQQGKILRRATKMMLEQLPDYSSETVAQVAQFEYMSGMRDITAEDREVLAAQTQAGLTPSIWEGALAGFGYNRAALYRQTGTGKTPSIISNLMLNESLSAQEIIEMTSAGNVLKQLGPAAYYSTNLLGRGATGNEIDIDALKALAPQLAQLEGTPALATQAALEQNWYSQLQLGRTVTEPALLTGNESPQQLRQTELALARSNRGITIAQQREDIVAQSFGDIIEQSGRGYNIQDWAAALGGATFGEEERGLARASMAAELRTLKEQAGETVTDRVMEDLLLGMTQAEVEQQYGGYKLRSTTKEQLGTLGLTQEKATAVAGILKEAYMRGPQGAALATQATQQLSTAAMLGINMEQYTTAMTASPQSADAATRAFGAAQATMSFMPNAQAIYDFASRGMNEATMAQVGSSLGQRVVAMTGNEQAARRVMGMALTGGGGNLPGFGAAGGTSGTLWMQNYMGMNPITMTQAAQTGMIGSTYATSNITLGGAVSTAPLFTSSMMQGDRNMTTAMLGPQLAGTEAGQAAQYGINALTGQVFTNQQEYQQAAESLQAQGLDVDHFLKGGQQGLQWMASYAGWKYQQAQTGNQAAQIALQEKWQPIFWDIQDRQTALQDEMQQWNFQMQEKQIGMQQRSFYQNMGLNMQQSQMQRGWTQEDWATNATMRQMQWGWRTEDFEEQSRFMTGRERKLAERSMERETITHTMQEEQISKQKERQKELWALEDQRFSIQRAQFEEQMALQVENLTKQREFFEEQTALRDEMTEAQRQYWREQIALQKAALGAGAEYAKTMEEISKAQMLISQGQQEASSKFQIAAMDEVSMINVLISGINHITRNAPAAFQSIISAIAGGEAVNIPSFSYNPGVTTGGDTTKFVEHAIGGPLLPGETAVVGERGAELIKSTSPLSVTPNNELLAQLYGQSENFSSAWNSSVTFANATKSSQKIEPKITVYIGNREIKDFIVETVEKEM